MPSQPAIRSDFGLDRSGLEFGVSLLAGQIAGLAFLLLLVVAYPLFLAQGPLRPLQVIAACFAGEGALAAPAAGNVAIGFLVNQLGPALFWSVIFGLVAAPGRAPFSTTGSLVWGLAVGAIAMVIDVYLLVPLFEHFLVGRDLWRENVPQGWAWIAHLLYGVTLGLAFVAMRNPLLERRRRARGVGANTAPLDRPRVGGLR